MLTFTAEEIQCNTSSRLSNNAVKRVSVSKTTLSVPLAVANIANTKLQSPGVKTFLKLVIHALK